MFMTVETSKINSLVVPEVAVAHEVPNTENIIVPPSPTATQPRLLPAWFKYIFFFMVKYGLIIE